MFLTASKRAFTFARLVCARSRVPFDLESWFVFHENNLHDYPEFVKQLFMARYLLTSYYHNPLRSKGLYYLTVGGGAARG